MSVLSDAHFHDETAAYAFVEARVWANGISCPHCGNADAAKIGRLAGKSKEQPARFIETARKLEVDEDGTAFGLAVERLLPGQVTQ